MLSVLKTGLKIAFSFILIALFFVIGLASWILTDPASVWRVAQRHFLPKDLQISWQSMDFDFHHISQWNFGFTWRVQGLSVHRTDPFIDFPFDDVYLEGSINPTQKGAKILLHQVRVIATKKLQLQEGSPPSKKTEKNPFQQLQGVTSTLGKLQKRVKFENVHIRVEQFLLLAPKGFPVVFSLEAFQNHDRQPGVLNFQIKGSSQSLFKGEAHGKLHIDGVSDWQLNSRVNLTAGAVSLKKNIVVNSNQDVFKLSTQGSIQFKKENIHLRARPKILLRMTARGADMSVDSSMEGFPGKIVSVRSFSLAARTDFEENRPVSLKASSVSATVPIHIYLIDKKMRPPLEKACHCKVPETLLAEVHGQVWLSNFLGQNSQEYRPVADLKLKIQDLDNKLISLKTLAHLKVHKHLDEYTLSPALDTHLFVHSFAGIRNFLKAKNILIPAPLDVLDGVIEAHLQGPVRLTDQGYLFSSSAKIRLQSERQRMNMSIASQGHLRSDLKVLHLKVQTLIDQLQLELPPLDPMLGKPRVVTDKRILKEPKSTAKPSRFQVTTEIHVATKRPAAIRLLSPFFEPYLPLTVNISRNDHNKNSGFIRAEPFDIVYLRRRVNVEKMELDMSGISQKVFVIDGRLQVQQSQYTVFIDIQGPANKPQITLSSEPYLPRSEIISVLLYDRTSDQILSADARTAGHVEAAVADRAIGLFGLWAFAATPIRSFSYNPITKVYSATLEVSDGVSASIGTNWEEATQVELRKRVSRQWMLTAAWTPADQDDPEMTKLILQWEKRF